ncbi:hypothetical protein F4860DRAFT_157871 [Xylaria cubensis]|nr:hypothetical protein F4860DRAFT_157871 [Xylaria cubensis]
MSPYIDNDLLAVGRWADDRAINQLSVTRSQQNSRSHYLYPSAEPQRRESRSCKADYVGSGRGNHYSRLSKAEDVLLSTHPRDAIREIRAAQMIQRQHPACFVKTEGGQQGNEATAKPSGGLSRVERHLLKQASAYLLLDEHEVKFRKVYWTGTGTGTGTG